MSSSSVHDFKYVLCPGSQPLADYRFLYEQIFQCWELVWHETYQELKIDKRLSSDAFTRQDYVGALFFENKCVGMAFFRWAYAYGPEFAQDSYFANWEESHLNELCSRGPEIIVCSNYTIHPSARGNQLPLPMRDLLLGMIIETFLNSTADAMTAATRLDRKVNEVCTRWGAHPIARNLPSGFGEARVDLLGFFKDVILSQSSPPLKTQTEYLWASRLEIPRENLHVYPSIPILKVA